MGDRAYDLIVAGGGLSGVAAAVAAARRGVKTLIIEQSGFLGGAPGNCLINPFMPNATKLCANGEERLTQLSGGIFREILNALSGMGALQGSMFHEEYLKLALDRMAVSAGVRVLLHATLCGANAREGRLECVRVVGKSGCMEFCAKNFIDCTGDADLAVMAGCPARLGREADGLCQPMTLCFRLSNVDMEKFREERESITPLYRKLQVEGKIKNPRNDVLMFLHPVKNVVHFNTTRVIRLNPVDPFDLTAAEMQAREQMFEMYAFLRENFSAFRNADIAASAPQIGVRESRMIDGRHVLTAEELKACTRFEDAIAAGNYDIDIHNPNGGDTSHYYFQEGEYYTIPYRSLQPLGVSNLLVAGRCISCTHEAQASVRIMPIVTTLGEAAGVAASVAHAHGETFARADVGEIQRILRENGAFLGI